MFLNYNKSTRIRISNPCECRLIPLSFFYNNLLSVDLHFKKSRIFAVGINPFNLHFTKESVHAIMFFSVIQEMLSKYK